MEKAEEAVADIMREVESASVVAMKLDLADTKSICEFAENIYNSWVLVLFYGEENVKLLISQTFLWGTFCKIIESCIT